VDDEKRQRRFQFSLRKLMLWMAVLGVYMGIMRSSGMGTTHSLGLALYLAGLAVVRLKWGYRPGYEIGANATGIGVACWLVHLMGYRFHLPKDAEEWLHLFVYFFGGYAHGVVLGFIAFVAVHSVVSAVDKIDTLMQAKTTPATDNSSNRTQRSDAASSEE
jgi:uncharacterized membrane protein